MWCGYRYFSGKRGSTAGTDIVAMIINKYRNISPGKIIMYIDVFIIGCSYFIGGGYGDRSHGKNSHYYLWLRGDGGLTPTRLIWYLLDRCNRYNFYIFSQNTRMWRIPLP